MEIMKKGLSLKIQGRKEKSQSEELAVIYDSVERTWSIQI